MTEWFVIKKSTRKYGCILKQTLCVGTRIVSILRSHREGQDPPLRKRRKCACIFPSVMICWCGIPVSSAFLTWIIPPLPHGAGILSKPSASWVSPFNFQENRSFHFAEHALLRRRRSSKERKPFIRLHYTLFSGNCQAMEAPSLIITQRKGEMWQNYTFFWNSGGQCFIFGFIGELE